MSNHPRPYFTLLLAATAAFLIVWTFTDDIEPEVVETAGTTTTTEARTVGHELELRIDRNRLQLERNQFERTAIALEAQIAVLEAELATTTTAPPPERPATGTLAELDARWFDAYQAGGGRNPLIFRDIILPCETGGERFPHSAIGPTDDWGRAQVNRPTWKPTFEARYDTDFETGITDPSLNGHFAAHIEQVQGLDAWTCYR